MVRRSEGPNLPPATSIKAEYLDMKQVVSAESNPINLHRGCYLVHCTLQASANQMEIIPTSEIPQAVLITPTDTMRTMKGHDSVL